MDFFEQANPNVFSLNESEKKIFEYVVRNIHEVSKMSVRTLADNCYVSTTTIMRFTKKLGFSGYREFTDSLKITCHHMNNTEVPQVVLQKEYSEEYLKNIIESVRVISTAAMSAFHQALEKSSCIYFIGSGLDWEIAHYAYHLFSTLGYHTVCPANEFEKDSALAQMKDNDVLFVFSYTGKDAESINFIETAHLTKKPVIVTLTQSGNNIIQSLSDIDFYVFTDYVKYKDADLTSRISMIATIELLVYSLIAKYM